MANDYTNAFQLGLYTNRLGVEVEVKLFPNCHYFLEVLHDGKRADWRAPIADEYDTRSEFKINELDDALLHLRVRETDGKVRKSLAIFGLAHGTCRSRYNNLPSYYEEYERCRSIF